ncbi:MAG: SAM hydrolase/SAM-dependent halogenase family protein, partial [Gaiellaceae bacterium]
MGALPITFLSDYGHDDEFAGVCRAVIARIAPDAAIVDLTHGVPPGDVRRGAVALADALPYAPPGVHLAVVDPGVGTARRALAVRVRDADRVLVGPDNGLLWPAIEGFGGAVEAVDVSASAFGLEPVWATFHGRDLFAPVAARVALGAALGAAGEAIEPRSLVRLEVPHARREDGDLVASVLYLDRFGNATLGARSAELEGGATVRGDALSVRTGGSEREATFAAAFADVAPGALLVYEDSSRRLALAVNGGSAAET